MLSWSSLIPRPPPRRSSWLQEDVTQSLGMPGGRARPGLVVYSVLSFNLCCVS